MQFAQSGVTIASLYRGDAVASHVVHTASTYARCDTRERKSSYVLVQVTRMTSTTCEYVIVMAYDSFGARANKSQEENENACVLAFTPGVLYVCVGRKQEHSYLRQANTGNSSFALLSDYVTGDWREIILRQADSTASPAMEMYISAI
jgi:hypothetical protein